MPIVANLYTHRGGGRRGHLETKADGLQANRVGSWRWPCGFCTMTSWALIYYSLGLVPNYVVLVIGNEGGDPRHMQGCHAHGLWVGLRKLVLLTLDIIKYLVEAKNVFSFYTHKYSLKV